MKRITKITNNNYHPFCFASLPHSPRSPLVHPEQKLLSLIFLLEKFMKNLFCLLWCCEKRGIQKKKMSKRTRTTTPGSSSKGSKKPRILPPSPHGPFWNGTTIDPEIIAVLKSNRDDAFHYDAETSRLNQFLKFGSMKLFHS